MHLIVTVQKHSYRSEAKGTKIYPLALSPIYEDDSSQETFCPASLWSSWCLEIRENANPALFCIIASPVSIRRLKVNFDEDGRQEGGEEEEEEDEGRATA